LNLRFRHVFLHKGSCFWADYFEIIPFCARFTLLLNNNNNNNNNNSVTFVCEQTMPTERSPSVGEVNANFSDRGCHVVSVRDSYGRIPGFIDRSRYFAFEVAPHLFSRGSVDPAPDSLLLRKSGSSGTRTLDLWICSQKL
jgi:hypothetical protein